MLADPLVDALAAAADALANLGRVLAQDRAMMGAWDARLAAVEAAIAAGAAAASRRAPSAAVPGAAPKAKKQRENASALTPERKARLLELWALPSNEMSGGAIRVHLNKMPGKELDRNAVYRWAHALKLPYRRKTGASLVEGQRGPHVASCEVAGAQASSEPEPSASAVMPDSGGAIVADAAVKQSLAADLPSCEPDLPAVVVGQPSPGALPIIEPAEVDAQPPVDPPIARHSAAIVVGADDRLPAPRMTPRPAMAPASRPARLLSQPRGDLSPQPADMDQIRHWAAPRGLIVASAADLKAVNIKRHDLGQPPFVLRDARGQLVR
jgi:hypothetical protein